MNHTMSIIRHSEFTKKVLKSILSIPQGRVATYKQIAMISGKPQGSRGVAWILHTCSTPYKLPWHRVLNSQGKISFEKGTHNFREQKRRLEKEGILLAMDGRLDLKKFQWKKKPKKRKSLRNRPQMYS